ncbi:class F sortase [Cellulomonas pakistanensis]|uniref:Class F sortase n=1 Tax=Cellulomonas pakistanensis TaxID=992287 RepID=A0A919U4X7_9CELL|nr:class F sortase [Cellulomonas pakistanensis]GIG37946.1 hypothetical protein Cpa01nite_33270 [Cellulomonas pakistanensis]
MTLPDLDRGPGRERARGHGRARRWAPVAALAVAGVLSAGAGVAVLASPPALRVAAAAPVVDEPDAPGAGSPTPAATPAGEPTAPVDARPVAPGASPVAQPAPALGRSAVAAPARLAVPDLDLAADVVPVGVDDGGALEVPADPRVVGWWSSGAVPGAPQGSTVLAAHVDAAGVGAGPLAEVLRAPVGTTVEVATTDGSTVRYAVTEVRSYPKQGGLPPDLFAVDGPPRLVLITCSGAFVDGRYTDNAVVVATSL